MSKTVSRHELILPLVDGNHILFNGLYGAIDVIDQQTAEYYEFLIRHTAAQYSYITPELLVAVIRTESNFSARVGTRVVGLMQVMAAEHTDRCARLNAYNLLDAKQNIRVGVDILAELIAYYDGDYKAALSFYNCDSTGEYAELVLSRAEILAESAMVEVTV